MNQSVGDSTPHWWDDLLHKVAQSISRLDQGEMGQSKVP